MTQMAPAVTTLKLPRSFFEDTDMRHSLGDFGSSSFTKVLDVMSEDLDAVTDEDGNITVTIMVTAGE